MAKPRTPRVSSRARGGPQAGESLVLRRIVWVSLALAWAFAAASLASFNHADHPGHMVWPANQPARNWCGALGAQVAYGSYKLLGLSAWLVLAGSFFFLIVAARGRRLDHALLRVIGLLMVGAAAAAMQAVALPGSGPLVNLPGGMLGLVGGSELVARFNVLGATLWLLLLGSLGMIVAFDRWLLAWPSELLRRARPVGEFATAAAIRAGGGLASLGSVARSVPRVRLDDLDDARMPGADAGRRAREEREEEKEPEVEVKPIARGRKASRPAPEDVPLARLADAEDEPEASVPAEEAPGVVAEPEASEPAGPLFSEAELREKISRLPIRFAARERKPATEEDLRDLQNVSELEGYRFPTLDLLEDPEEDFSSRLEELVREQAQALEHALKQYRIEGEVVGIESGPVITLYDVRLAPGTKVAQISAVSSDIARSLRAVNIRIVPNTAGRDTIGIEVPNPSKEKVRLKELMGKSETFARMRLPTFLGKDASGEPLITDLAQMPHMLIAGTTGSGKSVCINTIIMGFLYTKKPNELKLVLVDPKMVEMSQFKDIPHLMCPVVTEMSKAAAILEWACGKMDERYELLAEAGCRDIASYNELGWDELRSRFNPSTPEEEARIPRTLPYMVFVIDELADLMMTAKEVEGSIIRIAQKARAVGIHLILATQRPQANVVTGLIKSNMPCRVCFKVASGMDSRIVLDQKGGELLLGQGDMLYLSPRTSKLVRAQGTLVDDKEIKDVVRFMRDVARPTFERQLLQLRSLTPDDERLDSSQNNSSASLAAAQEDPLFDRAVEIVLETQRGSVSLLQRRLAIGYTRASRLIDLMGIAGILGEHKGSVAREVMIGAEEWSAMKALIEADAASRSSAGAASQGSVVLDDELPSEALAARAAAAEAAAEAGHAVRESPVEIIPGPPVEPIEFDQRPPWEAAEDGERL